ncbi:MAG: hypothetical protein ABIF06_00760 [bacterium]
MKTFFFATWLLLLVQPLAAQEARVVEMDSSSVYLDPEMQGKLLQTENFWLMVGCAISPDLQLARSIATSNARRDIVRALGLTNLSSRLVEAKTMREGKSWSSCVIVSVAKPSGETVEPPRAS